jgi:hypothetical protein
MDLFSNQMDHHWRDVCRPMKVPRLVKDPPIMDLFIRAIASNFYLEQGYFRGIAKD